jgi:hypothetical protein
LITLVELCALGVTISCEPAVRLNKHGGAADKHAKESALRNACARAVAAEARASIF